MSRMMVVGIRMDKLDEIEKLTVTKGSFSRMINETDYASPVLEESGIISSGTHFYVDSDNILLNKDGARYINSTQNLLNEKEKNAVVEMSGFSPDDKGMNIVGRAILKTDSLKVQKVKEEESPAIALFYHNTDQTSELKTDVFKKMVAFLRENEKEIQDHAISKGQYVQNGGQDIEKKNGFELRSEPMRFVGMVKKDTMVMINLNKGLVSAFALPNVEVNLRSNMLERDLSKSIGVSEKPEPKKKLKIS